MRCLKRYMVSALGFMGVLSCAVRAGDTWIPVYAQDFSDASALAEWVVDGSASISVTDRGEMQIETTLAKREDRPVRCSVVWLKRRFVGDLRIEFDARGDVGNRCIFLFNAQPMKEQTSIFLWLRPRADYDDYAGDERLGMYSLGMLRYDQDTLNFRYIGGTTVPFLAALNLAKPRTPERRKLQKAFDDNTILASWAHGLKDNGKMAHFQILIVGDVFCVWLDGRELGTVRDPGRLKPGVTGGWLGFRNFKPSTAWYDNLKVFRRADARAE